MRGTGHFSYRRSFFAPEEYGRTHHLLLASARAGNVIGGGDWAEDRLVPNLMKSASLKRIEPLRNPGAVRPWQHVLEPLSGYLLLGQRLMEEKKRAASPWNFGPAGNGGADGSGNRRSAADTLGPHPLPPGSGWRTARSIETETQQCESASSAALAPGLGTRTAPWNGPRSGTGTTTLATRSTRTRTCSSISPMRNKKV